MTKRCLPIAFLLVSARCLLGDALDVASESNDVSGDVVLRRPVGLAFDSNQQRLLVLNQESGTLSLIDPVKHIVLGEYRVGKRPASIQIVGDEILVADQQAHRLSRFRLLKQGVKEIASIEVSHSPVDVKVSRDRSAAFVSSLWSHRWSCFTLADNGLRQRCVIDLDFAPRHQCQVDSKHVLVADAFGGHWALIDVTEKSILKQGKFDASHNITGLALAGDGNTLYVSHVTLNHEKPTTRFNVHWGDIMLNVVRRVSVERLLNDAPKNLDNSVHYLGRPDSATGDPTGITIAENGRQIVCFAGVSQIGISDAAANSFNQINVGRQPSALTLNADQSHVFVANRLDDSISVVDIQSGKKITTINLGDAPKLTLAQQGEQLFYDSTLSSDGWFSCHTCHTDGHTNGGLADTFGDGQPGDAKRVLSLLGVVETGPWSWSGKVATLHEQVRKSVETTMRGPKLEVNQIEALVEFIKTLKSPVPVSLARGTQDVAAISRGGKIFLREGCSDCHTPGAFTSADAYDVGIVDELGNDHFNPPSLRAISHRGRLFHDNRADSVHDVVKRTQHQLKDKLSKQDENDLISFLLSL